MKRYLLSALTLGLAVLLVGGAYQAARNTGGVAVVHVDKVLFSIPKYVENDSIIGRERLIYMTEIRTLQSNLARDGAALDQKAIGMPPTQVQAQQQQLQARADSIDTKVEEYEQRLAERHTALLKPIEDRVSSIIEGLRAEGGYHIVVNAASPYSALLAVDPAVDLTPRVIERVK